jgi:hypothetical protein
MFTMSLKAFVVAALAAMAVSKPIPDPLHVMRQSGPAAGQVLFPSECASDLSAMALVLLFSLHKRS